MEWWGYSRTHGWVVLDREVACNSPDKLSDLLFIRCSDAETYFEPRNRWDRPEYNLDSIYIASLPPKRRESAAHTLAEFKKRWPEFKAAVSAGYTAQVVADGARAKMRLAEARNQLFNRLGLKNPGTRPGRQGVSHRVTHCFSCLRALDSADDVECAACGWIVCSCAACGCVLEQQSHEEAFMGMFSGHPQR